MPYALFAGPGLPDRDQRLAPRRGLRAGGRRRRRQAKARGRLQHQAVRAGPGPGRGTGLGPEPAKKPDLRRNETGSPKLSRQVQQPCKR